MKEQKQDKEINKTLRKEYLKAKFKMAIIQFGVITGLISVINLLED